MAVRPRALGKRHGPCGSEARTGGSAADHRECQGDHSGDSARAPARRRARQRREPHAGAHDPGADSGAAAWATRSGAIHEGFVGVPQPLPFARRERRLVLGSIRGTSAPSCSAGQSGNECHWSSVATAESMPHRARAAGTAPGGQQ